jgi:hypothetical protein
VKIALLALLVILAAATMVATIVVAFNEAPLMKSIKTNSNEENGYIPLFGEVQPQGDDKPGGWPN